MEELFQIVYYCKVSLDEAKNMPIEVRRWWINRVRKEREEAQKAAPHQGGR